MMSLLLNIGSFIYGEEDLDVFIESVTEDVSYSHSLPCNTEDRNENFRVLIQTL